MRSVCWFRNDLRVEDNPALYNACLTSKSVIGIFIVTQSQWKEHDDAKELGAKLSRVNENKTPQPKPEQTNEDWYWGSLYDKLKDKWTK